MPPGRSARSFAYPRQTMEPTSINIDTGTSPTTSATAVPGLSDPSFVEALVKHAETNHMQEHIIGSGHDQPPVTLLVPGRPWPKDAQAPIRCRRQRVATAE